MTLEQALTYVFKEITLMDTKRKCFSNLEAADTFSNSIQEQWKNGTGYVFGPFVNKDFQPLNDHIWYEVSYT